jgi:fatty-acid desaturase
MPTFRNDKTFTQPIIWLSTIVLTLLHAGAVAALFIFSWKALLGTVLLLWISGSLGVGMCYHRLLTHRGYATPKWVEYFLTVCGTLALEGGPITWVATHVFITKTPTKGVIPTLHATADYGRTWVG